MELTRNDVEYSAEQAEQTPVGSMA
jgi:hypothetical protein